MGMGTSTSSVTLGVVARVRLRSSGSKTLLEGRPNLVDHIKDSQVDLVINTPAGAHSFRDEKAIRRAAVQYHIPCSNCTPTNRWPSSGIRTYPGSGLGAARDRRLGPHREHLLD